MRLAAVALALGILGCKGSSRPQPVPAPIKHDPHSHARPMRVAVTHLSLDLHVDFTPRMLTGTAKLQLARRDPSATEVVLDTDTLTIDKVTSCATGAPLAHRVAPPVKVLGRALSIALPADNCVAITYRTPPEARALLWVEPAGTFGKQHPMLFTQSQAILARTWIPLQDTPGVRFTYDATVHVPPGQWALMSAENPQAIAPDGVFRFEMKQPIPSYLMALAVGDFAFRSIGPRTGVYAEPGMVDAAAAEFDEVEAMMKAAEELYGPYRWGRYDMLVLPPSFPYGGMENPRLTFLTPTVIAGDRSLVGLIAHELAHSWSGNLVTNATWNDFWLNEGFTTYVERRLMEKLRGKEYADIDWALGIHDLRKALADHSPTDPKTFLALKLGPDAEPDEGLGSVAYEKGALLLRALELAFGREVFDAFLRRRFDRLAFQSTDTETFEADANAELFAKHAVNWKLAPWLHEGGIPATQPEPTSKRVVEIQALATSGTLPPAGWTTLEWVIYLRAIPATVTAASLDSLDAAFKLTSGNAEILMHWLPLLIRADVQRAEPAIRTYLSTVGRRRMVTPVYKALMAGNDRWKALARSTYAAAKDVYHPLVREAIGELVK
ncbi:MAG: M1 family metallopeptidase [Deltaproteobacteria bacterium]|nr:M1 family metallopeptidase [Deltaproteobacteria bacterium]